MNKHEIQIIKQVYYRDECKCQKCGKLLNQNNFNISFRLDNLNYEPYNLVLTCQDNVCVSYFHITNPLIKNRLLYIIKNFTKYNFNTYAINYLLELDRL